MGELVEVLRENHTARVFLNRPGSFNSFDLETVGLLAREMAALATDEEVRAVILSGRGRAFCAGGDLRWVSGCPGGAPAGFHQLAALFHQAVLEIKKMPKPVIAAVNGIAAGGGFSLALACDFRIMAASASLRQAYTSNGLCIDGGGTFSLPRLVGLAKALEIAAFDRPISADEALALGLVSKIVPDAGLLEAAEEMAAELTPRSIESFGRVKALLNESFDVSLETQLEKERAGLVACASSPDGREGLAAFVEKRKPVFV